MVVRWRHTFVFTALLVLGAGAHLVAIMLLAADHAGRARRVASAAALVAPVTGTLAAVQLTEVGLLPAAMGGTALLGVCRAYARRSADLRPAGAVVWVTHLLFTVLAVAWGVTFLARLPVSGLTRGLLWAAVPFAAVSLPSMTVQVRESLEPLLRRRWHRPRQPLTAEPARYPMVSVQVPCHAEPPELVAATLDTIAALDYPDFEVLVIDNNTNDPSLWRPLEEHCRRLGPRFRFLHVEGITGAKAGALNWAAQHTHRDAELIAVVDADYQVRSDWLRHTVGYFDDPKMGFVQCPHAYRSYADSTFQRMANWEYAVFFSTAMVTLNEHNAGLTVGTMSLIRRDALDEAGGWAEWCLTEDSELAIRIHAAGYDSVYLNEPYGRGLIPETFDGYRQQRYRWTYGPVQELRRHWRLFLPGRSASPFTATQRVHHGNHGLDVALIGVRALALPFAGAAGLSMLVQGEHVALPAELWVASTAMLASTLALRWLVYRRAVGATLRQALGGLVAFAALSHVITVASLTALAGREKPWQRTDKFRADGRGAAALSGVRSECLLAAACAVVSGLTATAGGIGTALAVGFAIQALTYAAAPLLTLVAERGLRHAIDTVITDHAPRPERDTIAPAAPAAPDEPTVVATGAGGRR